MGIRQGCNHLLGSHADLMEKLAPAVLSADFPDVDIAWCFSALDLATVVGGVRAHLRRVPRDELIRLAGFLVSCNTEVAWPG